MNYEIHVVDMVGQHAAVVRGTVPHDGIPDFLGGAFGAVLAAAGGQVTGPPFARYDLVDGDFAIEAGFPVAEPLPPQGSVEEITLPGGTVAQTMHTGSYQGLGAAYAAVEAWLAEHGYEPTGAPWETYLDDPEVPEPRTVVSWPCRRAEAPAEQN
jgi:effector-binding domain-containing protein